LYVFLALTNSILYPATFPHPYWCGEVGKGVVSLLALAWHDTT
jgi:hypothetical protein